MIKPEDKTRLAAAHATSPAFEASALTMHGSVREFYRLAHELVPPLLAELTAKQGIAEELCRTMQTLAQVTRERDAAVADREAALNAQDAVRDMLTAQLAECQRERDAAVALADELQRERDAAVAAREALGMEWEKERIERTAVIGERNEALEQRAECRAECERQRSLHCPDCTYSDASCKDNKEP